MYDFLQFVAKNGSLLRSHLMILLTILMTEYDFYAFNHSQRKASKLLLAAYFV